MTNSDAATGMMDRPRYSSAPASRPDYPRGPDGTASTEGLIPGGDLGQRPPSTRSSQYAQERPPSYVDLSNDAQSDHSTTASRQPRTPIAQTGYAHELSEFVPRRQPATSHSSTDHSTRAAERSNNRDSNDDRGGRRRIRCPSCSGGCGEAGAPIAIGCITAVTLGTLSLAAHCLCP